MKEFNDMLNKGLAEVDTAERQVMALTLLTNLAHKRDLYYGFFLAMAGPSYQVDFWYWRDREKN